MKFSATMLRLLKEETNDKTFFFFSLFFYKLGTHLLELSDAEKDPCI